MHLAALGARRERLHERHRARFELNLRWEKKERKQDAKRYSEFSSTVTVEMVISDAFQSCAGTIPVTLARQTEAACARGPYSNVLIAILISFSHSTNTS